MKIFLMCLIALFLHRSVSANDLFDPFKYEGDNFIIFDPLGRLVNPETAFKINNPGISPNEIDEYDYLGSTKLIAAVDADDFEEAAELIKLGANVNVANAHKYTPVFYAKSEEMLNLLLNNGADVNRIADGYTPLDRCKGKICDILKANGGKTAKAIDPNSKASICLNEFEGRAMYEAIKNNKHNLLTYILSQHTNKEIEEFIRSGEEINFIDPLALMSPVECTVKRRFDDITELLLNLGADPNISHYPIMGTVAEMYVKQGDEKDILKLAQLLIDAGAQLEPHANKPENKTEDIEDSPLCLAVKKNSMGLTELFLNNGANPLNRCKYGYKPVWHVSNSGMLDLLLSRGALVNDINIAAIQNFTDAESTIIMLFDKGYKEPQDSELMLYAIRMNYEALATRLLQAGSDPNKKYDADYGRTTPLAYLADTSGNTRIAGMLIKAGADPDKSMCVDKIAYYNSAGKKIDCSQDLLARAIDNSKIDLAYLLIENKVNLNNHHNSYQMPTPLHLAIEQKNKDLVATLVAAGANVNKTDAYGESPFYYAVYEGDTGIIQILMDAGANPFPRRGVDPLDANYNDEIRQMVIEYRKSYTGKK